MSARVALVTGASRGIGAGIAARLIEDGYAVTATATSEEGAQRIRDERGIAAHVLQLGEPDSVESLVKLMADAPIEILVNNAGMTADGLAMRSSDADMAAVIQNNLIGTMRLARAVLRPMMRARWGRIISIGSVVASMGNAGQTSYAASKAGIAGFTRSLAREIGGRGITVNLIAPGFIETDMTAALDEDVQNKIFEQIAVGRFGQAREVAAAVSFLAGESSGYITGETLNVNGGLHMY